MTETINLICFNCKYFRRLAGGCDAFPEGIPDVILLENKHSKPLPQQKNDLVFTPKEGFIKKDKVNSQ